MRKTTFQSWFPGYRRLLLRQARLKQHLRHHHRRKVQDLQPNPVSVESESADDEEQVKTRQETQSKIQKQRKRRTTRRNWRNQSSSEIPDWLQEFKENLVDERVIELGDSHASSSHESSLEPQRRMVPGNHRIKTHFLKHRNCEICQSDQNYKVTVEKAYR